MSASLAASRPVRDRAVLLLRTFLPRGTLPVGAGLLVLGAGAYAHLAVAGHTLPVAAMAGMSVLWSVVYLLGLGVFLPVEQEITRQVAARTAEGEGAGGVIRRAAALTAGLLAIIVVALTLAARLLARSLFAGDLAMVGVLGAAVLGLAVTSVSRGALAGRGRFGAYGSQLAVDGALRVALAVTLGLLGVRSAAGFGLILTVAPLLAVAATAPGLRGALRPGPAAGWRAMGGRLGMLVVTMLLAQMVINAAVLSVRLLSPGDPAAVSALLAAAVLARLPLFVFTSVQTSLLPGLAGAAAAGDQARFRQLLARGCAIVTVLGLGAGVPTALLGPWLTRILFAARPVLGHGDFAWLAAGTLCYLLALVLGQAALALSRHHAQLLSWLIGVAVLAAVTLAPGAVIHRVVLGYAAGSFTVALALAVAAVPGLYAAAGRARARST
ncbi:MAG: polysaccharide biosynthesis protein [Gemmatimonadota bacterium]